MQKKKGGRQGGVTLLEVLVSLMILGSVMVGTFQLADMYTANSRASMAAQQMTTIGKAMQAYIKDNHSAVMALATATTPALITVKMLVDTNYLPANYRNTNSYGQTMCGLVLRPSATSEQLNALLVAENISSTQTMNDVDLAQVASTIGAAGGGVYSTPPVENITGAMGGWSIPVSSYDVDNNQGVRCDGSSDSGTKVQIGVGTPVMALWFAEEKFADALYRNKVGGRPELNQMNTPIQMMARRNTWTNTECSATEAGSFTLGPAVENLPTMIATSDPPVAGSGNGSPMSGQLLVCQRIPAVNGASHSYRWAPVASPAFWKFSDLPGCGGDAPYGQLATVLSSKEPKMGTGERAWNGKVYVCGFDSSLSNRNSAAAKVPKWVPVGVDDDGNINIHGTAGINKLNGILEIVARGKDGEDCVDYQWDGIISDATDGRLARDTDTGDVLVCKGGKWVTVGTAKRTVLQVHGSVGWNDVSSQYFLKCPDNWVPYGGGYYDHPTGGTTAVPSNIYLRSDDNGAEGTQSFPTYEMTCLSPAGTFPTVRTLRLHGSQPACPSGSTEIGRGMTITAVNYRVGKVFNLELARDDHYLQSPGEFFTYEAYCEVAE